MIALRSQWFGLFALASLLVLNLGYAQRTIPFGGVYVPLFGVAAVVGCFFGLVHLLARGAIRRGDDEATDQRSGLRRGEVAPLLAVAAPFLALLVYALATSRGQHPVAYVPEIDSVPVTLPFWVTSIPLAVATLCLAWAWLTVVSLRPNNVRVWLFALCVTMIASGAVGQFRALFDNRPSARLDTGLGGASILPTVFILVIGVLAGLAAAGYRPRLSLTLLGVAFVELVLTGSRAGLAVTGLLVVLLALRWGWMARGRARVALLGGLTAATAAGAFLVLWVPQLRRVLAVGDFRRESNLATAWQIYTVDLPTVLLGRGTGMVWPWYATDTGLLPAPGQGYWGWVRTPDTETNLLSNPHSLYLGILVEQGVLGIAILAVLLGFIGRAAWRGRHDPLVSSMMAAVGATLLAFAFDYYLLKNFGVSWVWWLVVFAAVRLSVDGDSAKHATAPATRAGTTGPRNPSRQLRRGDD